MLRNLTIGFFLLAGVVLAPAASSEPIVIRFSHVVSEDAPKGIGAARFQELVAQRLGGRVQVVVYPRSQRFNDDEAVNALLFGDVEMAAPSLSKFGHYSKSLQVFDLPFLFRDVAAVQRFQAGPVGQRLLRSMEPIGIRGLAYWDNGMKALSARKPFRVPADMKGRRFRIQSSDVIERQILAVGGLPLKMPFARAYEAMKLGLVDGQENAWSNIYTAKMYKVQRYFTDFDYAFLGYMVITNSRFWDGLPADIRGELESILAQVTREVNEIAAQRAVQDRAAALRQPGVELVRLSDAELQQWRQAWLPLRDRFAAGIGEEVMAAAEAANTP